MMPLRSCLATTILLLAALFASGVCAHGGTLIIQVRTDQIPGADFDFVRIAITHPDGSVSTFIHTALPSRRYDLGVRVLEVSELGVGEHTSRVALLSGSTVLVERQARYQIDDHFHYAWGSHEGGFVGDGVTIQTFLLIPNGELLLPELVQPRKTAALETDNDGSGTISAGDEVRYTIEFDVPHDVLRGSSFTDTPSVSMPLIPGSVTTTHGVVFRGNFAVDTDILINFDPILAGEAVRISYLTRVTPIASNQGALSIVAEGTNYPVLTDDPATQPGPDPTIVSLACGEPGGPQCCGDLDICAGNLGECKQDRDLCRDDLGACENTLLSCTEDLIAATAANAELINKVLELERSLAELLDDSDGDGVPAARDDCPATAAGDVVDNVGCSQAQFCSGIPVRGRGDERRCRLSDWGNDEPVGNPQDCRPLWGRCAVY